jgi:Putative peptidoglycan binding domain
LLYLRVYKITNIKFMFKKIFTLILMSIGMVTASYSQSFTDTNSRYAGFCNSVNSVVVRGENSQRVRELQFLIKQQYAFGQGITGFYGALTEKNVRWMQRQLGINPSGAVGPFTLAKLQSLWCTGTVINPNPVNSNAPVISINPISSNGNNVTIGWATTNANSCGINGENVGTNGSKNYTIYNETTYRIICISASGISAEKILQVRPNGNINNNNTPVISLAVNPTNVTVGQYANLYWTSTNANTCTLNGSSISLNSNQSIYVQSGSQVYTLYCSGSGGNATQSITVSAGGVINNNNSGSVTTSGTYQTSNQMSINWQIPSQYDSEAQGVIVDLIDVNTNLVVGTVGRYINTQSSVNFKNGSVVFTIPKSIRDSRNDAIPCQTINGETLCGNLVKSGNYKIRTTYFTPSNACFGFCQTVSGQKTLGSVESNGFYINSTVSVGANNNYNLSLNTTVTSNNNFVRGGNVTIQSTVKNNGSTSISFPSGSSSCPSDIMVTINGVDFYNFIGQGSRPCTADYRTDTLAPGQSITRTFTGNIPSSEQTGTKNVIAKFRAQINNENNFTEVINNTSFNLR